MGAKEIKNIVEKKAPEDLRGTPFLSGAIIDVLEKEGQWKQYMINDIILLAGEYRKKYIAPPKDKNEDQYFSLTPNDLLTTEILIEKITPWAEELRELGFGQTKTPFSTAEEANLWIEQIAAEDRIKTLQKLGKKREKAIQLIKRIAIKYNIQIRYSVILLSYPGKDGWLKRVTIWSNSYLLKLAKETKRMAGITGFHEASLVHFVLGGLKPIKSRIKVACKSTSGKVTEEICLNRNWTSIEIDSADLSFEELRGLQRRLRGFLGGKKKKGVSEYHWELYRMVTENGGPPTKKKILFWEEMKKRWNKRYPEKRYSTWNGVKKAYLDVKKRSLNKIK